MVSAENFTFPHTLPKELLFKGIENHEFKINGANVDWYASNKSNYSGCQFIIAKSLLISALIPGMKYGAYVNFNVNGTEYSEALDPNGCNIPFIEGMKITGEDNQLFIEIGGC